MKILYKYLIKNIIKNLLILLGIFSIVITSSQLLHLPSIVYHSSFIDFLKVLLLVNFSFFKFSLLFSFFIGTALVGYNLRENRELHAIYSAGISLKKILIPILITSIVFSLLASLVSLILVPYSNRERAKFLTLNVKEHFFDALQEHNFTEISKNTLVYVEKKTKNGFKNTLIFNKKNKQVILGKEAEFGNFELTLKNGSIQIPTKNGFNLLIFSKNRFKIDVDYMKQFEFEDWKNNALYELAKSSDKRKYKAIAILTDRVMFPIPFIFMGILGFLIGVKTKKGRDYVLSLIISISILYLVLSFYLIKLIGKGTLSPIIYAFIVIFYFSSITLFFYKKD